MHQPLSNFPWASIVRVFTFKYWTQIQVCSLFTFTRQFLESLFSSFLLHHYPLFTSLPPCSLCTPSVPLLLRVLSLHFELFASLSSLLTSSPSRRSAPQPPPIPPPPTPYCEFWRLGSFSEFQFKNLKNKNEMWARGCGGFIICMLCCL